MTITLAFDVYGTLIDTAGVVQKLERHVGTHATSFSNLWREKQLEYSFRRGLMQNYRDFSVCTRNALDYVREYFQSPLTAADKEELVTAYRFLPAFSEVKEAMIDLKASNCRLFAFSNGPPDDLQNLLGNAGLINFFEDVVSVDEIKSFKPNPAVYCHFLRRAGALGSETWLISSNPFDVIGAISAGMRSAWVKRSQRAIFDPWEIEPTVSIGSLLEIKQAIGI